MSFSYDAFVDAARGAARSDDATKAVRAVLAEMVADPEKLAAEIPPQDEDEIMLFEDETVSIWSCIFQPHVVMPPHEHRMPVHIGCFRGGEKSYLYRREGNTLKHITTKTVMPGEVFSMGGHGIHAVTADGDTHSHALHVYTGPLMQITRSLFDWDTGATVDFTMENFHTMKKSTADLADLDS